MHQTVSLGKAGGYNALSSQSVYGWCCSARNNNNYSQGQADGLAYLKNRCYCHTVTSLGGHRASAGGSCRPTARLSPLSPWKGWLSSK